MYRALRPRVIPCLLLRGTSLVKTVKFKDSVYLGDPRNAVKIFNDKEADELVLLDITATIERRHPRLELIREIASESFMPLGYGGGICTLDEIKQIIGIGFEKVIINTCAVSNPKLVEQAARAVGSQSVVVSIDARQHRLGKKYEVFTHGGRQATGLDPASFATEIADRGAGEILLNAIDRDGTMIGYDLDLVSRVVQAVRVPVVACGGAGSVDDLVRAVRVGGAAAAAAGSLFVFHGRHRAVLISFPTGKQLDAAFAAPQ